MKVRNIFVALLAVAVSGLISSQVRGNDKPVATRKTAPAAGGADAAIPIAEIKHTGPVNFQTEILPILRRSCIACHNSAKAENHLVLESPQAILKGGESGPAIVPKHGAESLLLKAAAHLDDPTMPPPDNNVKATALSSNELGLIKLWIDQGATGQVDRAHATRHWQRLAATVRPILAVAVSPDGELAACGRDNEIYVYGLGSGARVARLVDPVLATYPGAGGQGVSHLDLVQSLAFQPQGDLLASGGFREVKLWQRPRNVRLATLASGPVTATAVSPDGAVAATGAVDGTIRLWDLHAGVLLLKIAGHSARITSLAFAGDGKTFYSGSLDKSVRAWRTTTGSPIGSIALPAAVNAIVIADHGTQICTGEADGIIRVSPISSLMHASNDTKPVKELRGHSGSVTALATFGAGEQVFSGSADGTVRLWNLKTGKQIRLITRGASIESVAVRFDGKRFATAGADKIVRLWNGENFQPIAALHGDLRRQLESERLARVAEVAGIRLAEAKQSISEAEASNIQQLVELKKAGDQKAAAEKDLAAKTAALNKVASAKSTAEKQLAEASVAAKAAADKASKSQSAASKNAADKHLVKLAADAKQASEQARQKVVNAKNQLEAATRAIVAPLESQTAAQNVLAAAKRDNEALYISIRKGADALVQAEQTSKNEESNDKSALAAAKLAARLAAESTRIRCVAFSPGGFYLAMGGDDRLVQTVSADDGSPADWFAGSNGAIVSIAFTPAHGLLAGGDDHSAIVWNTEPNWQLIRTIGSIDDSQKFTDRIISLDFSPDGRRLVTGGGYPSQSGELKVWNVADGSLISSSPEVHSDAICSVRFSPDGTLVASGATDRTMKITNAATGALLKTFEGHSHHVLGVAWRADGKQLATAGGDNVAKIWDFVSGEQQRTIEAFSKEVTAVTYVGASRRILTSCGDHYVRLFNTDNGNQDQIYFGTNDFLYSLGVTPGSQFVAAGGQDGVLRVWNVANAKLVRSFDH